MFYQHTKRFGPFFYDIKGSVTLTTRAFLFMFRITSNFDISHLKVGTFEPWYIHGIISAISKLVPGLIERSGNSTKYFNCNAKVRLHYVLCKDF